MSEIWYHGTPLELTTLLKGSTITQDRHLAKVFSHKPAIVSIQDDGTIHHNGTQPGLLYHIAEAISSNDVYPHPHSSMAPGLEWLTKQELQIELIGPVKILEEELSTPSEMEMLQKMLDSRDQV